MLTVKVVLSGIYRLFTLDW